MPLPLCLELLSQERQATGAEPGLGAKGTSNPHCERDAHHTQLSSHALQGFSEGVLLWIKQVIWAGVVGSMHTATTDLSNPL